MSERWLEFTRDPDPWEPPKPLPGPVLTDRLVVRLYAKGDGEKLFRAVDRDRTSFLPWMAWVRTDQRDATDSIYYVEKCRRSYETEGTKRYSMGIFERATGDLWGGTGFHGIKPDLRQAEIGYWMRSDVRGKGLCTEAMGGLISAGLSSCHRGGWGFRRVVVGCAAENVASRRVCEKLGLRLEAHMRQELYLGPEGEDGAPGYHDTYTFAVLHDEWDFENHRARPGIGWDRQ